MATPSWLQSIASIAPGIATALGGPLAGLAVDSVESVFGLKDASPDDLKKQLQNAQLTGDQIVALKQAEIAFQEKLKQNDIDLAQLSAKDADSARNREIQVKDRTPAILAYTLIGGFIGISAAQLIAIMGYPDLVSKIDGQGWLLIGNVSGYLANEAKQAASYYFGDTLGSKAQGQAIADIAKMP